MPIKHIFFDLDHTLWDFETNSAKAYEICFKNNNIDIDIERFLKKYISINFKYWKLYRENRVTKEALKYGRLKDAFDAIEYSISDQLINQLAIEYLEYLPKFNALFDGTKEILEYLKPKYKLHIITNGFNEVQQSKLEHSGIMKYFTELITSENVGVKKPDPKVFYYALDRAKAEADQSMMIGDSFEADVQGALNVGMKAIHFNPTHEKTSNGYNNEIFNLFEIKKYL